MWVSRKRFKLTDRLCLKKRKRAEFSLNLEFCFEFGVEHQHKKIKHICKKRKHIINVDTPSKKHRSGSKNCLIHCEDYICDIYECNGVRTHNKDHMPYIT